MSQTTDWSQVDAAIALHSQRLQEGDLSGNDALMRARQESSGEVSRLLELKHAEEERAMQEVRRLQNEESDAASRLLEMMSEVSL